MKKEAQKYDSAFSLIELSVAILVIGILIAGVIQGSKLVKKSQLKTAQALTTSSPVTGVKNLSIWYETSLSISFKSTESADAKQVSAWYDNNPQSINKNNAAQLTPDNQPKYYENVFGAIPAIRFDGTNDYLRLDGSFLANTNYTAFVVVQRRSNASLNYIYGGTGAVDLSSVIASYGSSASIRFSHVGSANGLSTTISDYSLPIPQIHTFWFSQADGKKYWLNGGINADGSSSASAQKLPALSNVGFAIGRYDGSNTGYFNGDIAEVIMFSRDLKTEERQAIESYLGQKYDINIS